MTLTGWLSFVIGATDEVSLIWSLKKAPMIQLKVKL